MNELHEEIGGLHARLDELEQRLEARDGAGTKLAEEFGNACLRVLRDYPKTHTATAAHRRQEGQRR